VLKFDTVRGLVRVTPTVLEGRVPQVSMVAPSAAVLHGGLPLPLGHRQVRVDIVASGELYGLVDGEAVGLPVDADHVPDLRRAAQQIITATDALPSLVHPLDASQSGIAGVVFTAPARDTRAGLKSVMVTRAGQVNRSASANAIAAIMAVLDAMGVIGPGDSFVAEGLIATHLIGRIAGRTFIGEHPAIAAQIEGSAWITGDHAFVIDPDDPLKDGFRV
jgi:proline racemase